MLPYQFQNNNNNRKKFKAHTQENLFTLFYTKYSKFSHCLSNSKFLGFVYVESLHEIKC